LGNHPQRKLGVARRAGGGARPPLTPEGSCAPPPTTSGGGAWRPPNASKDGPKATTRLGGGQPRATQRLGVVACHSQGLGVAFGPTLVVFGGSRVPPLATGDGHVPLLQVARSHPQKGGCPTGNHPFTVSIFLKKINK
jgi:hypothetical protein